MAELNVVAINGSTADVTSEVLDTSRMDNVFFQVTATVTAATLSATLAITNGIALSPGGTLPPAALPAAGTSVISGALPAEITLGSANGVFTFNNLGIGTTTFIAKLVQPAPLTRVIYDYTSGGGTVSLVVRAYGWKFP